MHNEIVDNGLSLKQMLIWYSEDVVNGDVVACKKHRWACMRFLKDIEREGTEEFPYIFDESKAMRFFDWCNLFKHTKGVLKGQNIVMADIQYFNFGNIYGWNHKDTGYRRFRKAYWQVSRKNAKSQSLACVASYEAMAFGENMSEVYIGATKTEQAKIVWNETEAMLAECPELKGKFKISYGVIRHDKSRSVIKALSKEDRKTGDGTNPQCGIIDEYHAHETAEIYNVIDSGMIARTQPLLMIITTAGSNINAPCYTVEYPFVNNLLDPDNPVELETYFAMVNELDKDEDGNLIDDITDERVWPKANPIVCSYPEGVASLRARLEEANQKPEVMDDFLTKNMNVWINQRANGYMRMDKWAACGADIMPDLTGLEVYVGLDLSKKIDLTSVGFVFPLKNSDKYAVLSHSFMPEDTLAYKMHTDKVNYAQWARNNQWITVTPGSVVDYRFVQDYMLEQIEKNKWKVREVCYDDWSAGLISQQLMERGFEMVEIRQGFKTLSEPTKNFREHVLSGNIIHNKNPVLSWAVGNAITKQDHNENIMLDKDKSTNRIDPIAAVINAHVRAYLREQKRESIYKTRGAFAL